MESSPLDVRPLSAPAGFVPDKITGRHRDRLAIVYVRQSTIQQTLRHQESTRLQYALADRAFQLGWARETILTIDDDLGRSGATVEGRVGTANHVRTKQLCKPPRCGRRTVMPTRCTGRFEGVSLPKET